MSDTITAPVTENTPAPAPPTEQTPTSTPTSVRVMSTEDGEKTLGNPSAEEARRLLYEKHYGTTPPADTPAPTTPAETVSSTQAEPTVPTTPTPVAFPPEVLQALQSLQAEIAAIKNQTKRPAPEVDTTAEPEPDWIALLREGRINEAKAALVKDVAKEVQPAAVEQAVARAREMARAEAEVESFVKDLKTANPELAVMESFVTADAQSRIAAAQAAGKIKTTEDAVREYKKAVLDATESARKIAQTLRGSGKTEAMTRNREVLSASTPTPNQIAPREETPQEPQEPVMESPESYMEKRRARELALKNPFAR